MTPEEMTAMITECKASADAARQRCDEMGAEMMSLRMRMYSLEDGVKTLMDTLEADASTDAAEAAPVPA